MANLKLLLFGPPRIELDGKTVEIRRRKVLAMLIYLAVTRQPHTRDALATLFYPDHPQQRARTYLRRDLAVLNSSLNNEWLITNRETVELAQSPALWVDAAIFTQALTDTQAHDHPPDEHCPHCQSLLDEAAHLYSDDFLTGFTLRDCPEFDDWQFFEAESLRQNLASILERLSTVITSQENVEAAISHARRWVSLDPLHEPAQRKLMHLYALAGQQAAALRQYETYTQLLEKELGLPPEEDTTTLYEAIKAKRLVQPFLKSEAPRAERPDKQLPAQPVVRAEPPPAPPTTPAPSHNLPAQSTGFVGRQQELARLSDMLADPDCRLVTMVGPGGIGKTRLSIEVARATSFKQGIWFVPLAPLTSSASIIPAIADSLNLSLQGSTNPKQQLLTYLRDRELLLVLDNFEHLLPGATGSANGDNGHGPRQGMELIADLLAGAPRLKILITSRERLNLSFEWVFTMEGLQIPDSDEIQGVENYSAVQLFIQLARRVDQNIGWHPMERSSIARICRLVGGMPLGIELAAAWVSVLPVIEIPHEIERNLDFLASTMHDLPERHRSMRAIFDQSWRLLTETERVIFRRLSVFQGSFTRTAIEVVCGEQAFKKEDLELDEAFDLHLPGGHFEILQALSGLVGKSFLRQITPAAADGESPDQAPASPQSGRYETHELMRQYGATKLAADPDEERQTRDR
ncbi:MAG: BTAD domain-containing putative transcriptional regulator, partial [Anaerolineae bacterium]|nr:BTAD domain-containing putative transcriptional regulator [Anaerolineae bacterium]